MTRVVCDFLHDARARALEIACDSRKQKLYHVISACKQSCLKGPVYG